MDKNLPPIPWQSSYEENNYGELFYALTRIYQPEKVVELGTKAGYSAYYIARGLKDNGHGTLDCYDLWEEYPHYYGFGFVPKSVAEENLKEYREIVKLRLQEAFGVDKQYDSVDILHVDLDNDGEILEKIVPLWIDKVRQFILIEGGSVERDMSSSPSNFKKMPLADWLKSLGNSKDVKLTGKEGSFVVISGEGVKKEQSINTWLKSFKKQHKEVEHFTFERFPSLTIIKKTL